MRPEGSTKDYSAKYITFLRLLGFDFTVAKDGRKIVSYTVTKEPANVADIRAAGPKVKKSKTVTPKTPKAKAPVAPKAKVVAQVPAAKAQSAKSGKPGKPAVKTPAAGSRRPARARGTSAG